MKNIYNLKILFYIFIFVIFSFFVNACNTGEIDFTTHMYCDVFGTWQPQKAVDASCRNDYECLIGSCKSGKCQEFDIVESVGEQQSVIQEIIDYFYPPNDSDDGSHGGGGGGARCGNSYKESGEVCDKTDVAGKNCYVLGFTGGTLKCASNCTAWNTTGCYVTTPQGNTCTPVCSSVCGGESSGCGTTCIYNDGAYCAENSVCESGNCVEKLECQIDTDCLENELCSNNKCLPKPVKKSILPTILIVLLILVVIGVIVFFMIKKKKKGGIVEDKKKTESKDKTTEKKVEKQFY